MKRTFFREVRRFKVIYKTKKERIMSLKKQLEI
jgi:hypothetical protein